MGKDGSWKTLLFHHYVGREAKTPNFRIQLQIHRNHQQCRYLTEGLSRIKIGHKRLKSAHWQMTQINRVGNLSPIFSQN